VLLSTAVYSVLVGWVANKFISVDLVSFVFLSLILGYAVPHEHQPPPYVLFTCCILSIIPLAYYIGMAVARYATRF